MGEYNYKRFRSDVMDLGVFDGPDVGDRYRDAELQTLEGDTVLLSSLIHDKPLVLELGSMTCPMYGKSVPPMQKLATKYPELNFAVMYVREAHPGERVPAHGTLADKANAARKSCDYHGEHRMVLIDDLDGTAHSLYGSMFNSIFVIGMAGTILFRSIWNNAEDLDDVLGRLVRQEKIDTGDLKPKPPFTVGSMRTLLAGGFVSLYDFFISLASLIGKHRQHGNM